MKEGAQVKFCASDAMRLLFIDFTLPQLFHDDEYPIGGWAVQLKILLDALRESGHKSGVLTWKGANDYVGPQMICDLVETYDPSKGIRKLRTLSYFIPTLLAAARRYEPDAIIQSCSALNTGIMAFAAYRLGVPFVHRLASDTDADNRYKSYLTKPEQIAFRYGLRSAKLIVCQNAYQMEQMRRTYSDKRLLLLKNAFQELPKQENRQHVSSKGYIAWIGIFRYQKNLMLLRKIACESPSIQFRVAGALPDQADSDTSAAVAALKLLPNVRMCGYVKRGELYEFLSGARALLSTSNLEGFSNTFLEALSCGIPVIARAAIDPDSMIAKNHLGLIARDEGSLSSLVRRIWDMDEDNFAEMSARCRNYVEMHHSAKKAAETLVSALQALIDLRSPAR